MMRVSLRLIGHPSPNKFGCGRHALPDEERMVLSGQWVRVEDPDEGQVYQANGSPIIETSDGARWVIFVIEER